jgi:ankyrin repeat protein
MRLDRQPIRLALLPILAAMSGIAAGGVHDDILFAIREDRTAEVVGYLQQGMDPDTSDASGTTLLMTAAANGNLPLVEILLRVHASTLKINRFGESALALAALNGHTALVRALVEGGAPVNMPGWGAIHYAVFNGHAAIVEYLIERGADLNARAPNRYTPLMLAARNGRCEVVRILLAAGANPGLGDLEGNTAVKIAQEAGNQEIVSLLGGSSSSNGR